MCACGKYVLVVSCERWKGQTGTVGVPQTASGCVVGLSATRRCCNQQNPSIWPSGSAHQRHVSCSGATWKANTGPTDSARTYALNTVGGAVRNRWVGRVARMKDKRNAYRVLVGNRAGTGPLRRHRGGLDDNIKMDRKGVCRMGWTELIGLG